MSSPPLDVDALLDDPAIRILVCCGSGGVGKTTTSAALALRAADRGRRVAVLTIDPARRLAQALGLAELGNEPGRVAGVPAEPATPPRLRRRSAPRGWLRGGSAPRPMRAPPRLRAVASCTR